MTITHDSAAPTSRIDAPVPRPPVTAPLIQLQRLNPLPGNASRALTRYRARALTGDAVAAALAGTVGYLARFGLHLRPFYLVAVAVLPLAWGLTVASRGGYEQRFLGTGTEEYRRVGHAVLWLMILAAVGSYLAHADASRAVLLFTVPACGGLTLLWRNLLRRRIYRLRCRGQALQRVLLIGPRDAAGPLVDALGGHPEHGLAVVATCTPEQLGTAGAQRSTSTVDAVLQAVAETAADAVAVVPHPELSGHALRRLSWALDRSDVDLIVAPGIVEVAGPRLSIRPVAGLSLLHLERPTARRGRMLLKSAFDRVGGALLLVAASPALLLAALAVKLDSRGPVLFRQRRVGVDGRGFTMLKFRSMTADAEQRRAELVGDDDGNGMLFKLREDPRVTRVGTVLRRYSLDELPQLVNVLRGEMSLVGPRPPLPEEVRRYQADALRRLRVRPGMTGLWQVSGRSDLSWEESLLLDLRYVDNWSIAMDLTILWRTCRAVLNGGGAY
jgi:exopolysaccharide biosynthesis polyprenyl glycosylphosphotransferase